MALKTFLTSIKSEIVGSTYNKVKSNISKLEREALESLVKMQRNCIIVIKPCDKGAGIIICDYADYVMSCEKDLASCSVDNQPHYSKI